MAPKYASVFGFNKIGNYTVDIYSINVKSIVVPTITSDIIVKDVTEVDIEKVLDYDESICPEINKRGFVKQSLLESKNQIVKVAVDENDNVIGIIRLSELIDKKSGRIGPFYVENKVR